MMPSPEYPRKPILVLKEKGRGIFIGDQNLQDYDYVIRVLMDGTVTIEGDYLNTTCTSLMEADRMCNENLLVRQTLKNL